MKEIFNAGRLKEITRNALPAFAFADMSQVTATASLLPGEPWQIALLKYGLAGYLTYQYGLSVASRLRENEGSSKLQKFIANKNLIGLGTAIAALDTYILTAPF